MKNESIQTYGGDLIDPYTSLGYALKLLGESEYHKNLNLGEYISTQILPPLWASQIRFYLSAEHTPIGMVSWAKISEEVRQDMIKTDRFLRDQEWDCGELVFINDFIAVGMDSRSIIRNMMGHVFPGERYVFSLRRNPDGSIKKINRWTRPCPEKTASGRLSLD